MFKSETVDSTQLELFLTGSLYVHEVQALRAGLSRCLDEGKKMLSLDFSQVEYIDCTGLGALVYVHKMAQQKGACLVIRGVRGRSRYLFELARLDRVLVLR